jgi:hypothetical protein
MTPNDRKFPGLAVNSTSGEEVGLRRFGINLTSDPHFSSKSLFVS